MLGAILAGGKGKRLRPLTEKTPKPLLEIKENYTILDKQLLQFKYAGINEVYLLVGYLHEKIMRRYGEEWQDIKINYLVEKEPLGTAGALKNLFDEIDETCIVRNGDVVTDVNLKEMIAKHGKAMTMFVTKLRSPYGICEIQGNKIIGFREKPLLDYYINAGIYIISPEIFDYFKKYEKGDVEKLVFPKLAREGLIYYYYEDCYWRSIDSVKDLEEVRNEFKNRIDKPWGYERIICLTEKYLTKELYIMKDFSTSLHYHEQKDETLHCQKGECLVEIENNGRIRSKMLKGNDTLRIKPKVKHRIVALENSILLEYSTPHPVDTVRVEEYYGRD